MDPTNAEFILSSKRNFDEFLRANVGESTLLELIDILGFMVEANINVEFVQRFINSIPSVKLRKEVFHHVLLASHKYDRLKNSFISTTAHKYGLPHEHRDVSRKNTNSIVVHAFIDHLDTQDVDSDDSEDEYVEMEADGSSYIEGDGSDSGSESDDDELSVSEFLNEGNGDDSDLDEERYKEIEKLLGEETPTAPPPVEKMIENIDSEDVDEFDDETMKDINKMLADANMKPITMHEITSYS
jgi:hypothetical protein